MLFVYMKKKKMFVCDLERFNRAIDYKMYNIVGDTREYAVKFKMYIYKFII